MKKSNPARGKKRKKVALDQLAARLAPLEEQVKPVAEQQIGNQLSSTNSHSGRDPGAIIVDNENLKVSGEFMETRAEKRFLGLEPVVLVVLIIMLSFIAFIAWQISLMPTR